MRTVDLATTAVGSVSLLAPHLVMRLSGAPADEVAERTVRVLGARQVIQGVVLLLHPSKTLRAGAVALDATHAASMLALAGLDPRARRAALTSATLATGFAVANAAVR